MKKGGKTAGYTRKEFEIMRKDAKERFEELRTDWIEKLLWTIPSRARYLLNTDKEKVSGYHIFDGTHILAQRSNVAGFLEGNTSPSRPWIRYVHPDPERNRFLPNREYLDLATTRALGYLASSNFYSEAAQFYYDLSVVDTGVHIIKKRENGIHFFTLEPGSYFLINNAFNEVEVLIREFTDHSQAVVKRYCKNNSGKWDYSNVSNRVKEMFERNDTKTKIEMVEVFCRNKAFSLNEPVGGSNRLWTSVTYETGVSTANGFGSQFFDPSTDNPKNLEVNYYRRKPFIVGKAQGKLYGEKGPTTDAIGLIRSVNKKAISKDIAIEKILDPTTQGPASIRKTYLTTQARRHIPLDATAMSQGGIKSVYDINPAIVTLATDVEDMRRQIEKFYYADFLLFLSNNPKTRTATEAQGVIDEQRSVIGPNLQSLNTSYNVPISDFLLDYVIHEDPYLPPPPEDLQGERIETEFVSVFAQVQKAFDLPQINNYVQQWMGIAQLNPQAMAHLNLQKLADIYEDRYQLPAGLNNPASKVEEMMRQAAEQQQRQQMMESIPMAAQANKTQAQAEQIKGESEQSVE